MFYEFRTGYYHKWWKKVPPNKHRPICESMVKQYFTQQSPLVISKLWSIIMEETCPFRSWNVVVLLMSIIHRRSTQIKKATSNTTKKMTRVITSNSRLLKFKITEIQLQDYWIYDINDNCMEWCYSDSIILCCRTNNESFSILKTNHIQNYTTLNKKWIF